MISIKRAGTIVLTGIMLAGLPLFGENAKIKSLVSSKYYDEFEEWDEDVQKDSIACSATTVKNDVPVFLAEVLNNLGYKVADIEIKESKGCLGLFVLLTIICMTPTISLLF